MINIWKRKVQLNGGGIDCSKPITKLALENDNSLNPNKIKPRLIAPVGLLFRVGSDFQKLRNN